MASRLLIRAFDGVARQSVSINDGYGEVDGSPPTPSNGRWTTSNVARNGDSSLILDSKGPDADARAPVEPTTP